MSKVLKKALVPLLLNLFLLIISCEKKDAIERLFPKVSTLEVVDITENGAVFGGLINNFPLGDILDHGFVYGIEGSEIAKISLGPYKTSDGKFNYSANRNLIIGKSYIVKAFAQTKSHLVYGPVINFISKGGVAPIIKSFSPQTAGWGDTIKITGDYFSSILNNNRVKFNSEEAKLVYANDTLLKVIVPITLNSSSSSITVSSNEKTTTASKQFEIAKPLILSMSDIVNYGGILLVTTKNIKVSLAILTIDDKTITTNQTTENNLAFTIPKTYAYGIHKLKILQFGNTVERQFFYNAPTITTVFPKLVAWGNTLNIVGRNFSAIPTNSTIVFVENTCITYTFKIVNDTLIQVPVPDCIKTGNFTISLKTPNLILTSSTSTTLQIKPPELLSFDKTEVNIGESITAVGRNIGNADLIGYIDNIKINPSFRDSTHFQFTIPGNLDAGKHNFKMTLYNIGSNSLDFNVKKLKLTSFKEEFFCRAGRLTIYGENFGKDGYNSVTIDKTVTEVLYCDNRSIVVRIPINAEYKYSSSPEVIVNTGLQSVVVPDKIKQIEPWEMVSELNTGFDSGAKFSIGNDFYISSGNSNNGEFYCFNSIANSWKRIADYPGGRVIKPVCFIIEGKAYVGLGDMAEPQKFWCYYPETNLWKEVASCPLKSYPSNFGFGVNHTGYVGNVAGTIYFYNPSNNTWELGNSQGIRFYSGYTKNAGFGSQSKGYLICGDYTSFSEFDPITNNWEISSFNKPLYCVINSDANAASYDKLRNVIFVNAYIPPYYAPISSWQIYYWDFKSKRISNLYPPPLMSNAILFSSEEGELYFMTNGNSSATLYVSKFNFNKYELIKDQINDY